MTDFYYLQNGLLARIIPNSPEAVAQYQAVLDATNPNGIVLEAQISSIKLQFKSMGYSLRKLPKRKSNAKSDLELLEALR